MKIAIITDTHYGARKGSKHIHDYFELFYKNVFFPSLEEHNIDTVIHMGDIFDSRKAIDLQSLEWAKKVVFEPLKKYKVHAIIGNHDCYYKDTNYVNSPELLLNNYSNITTYSELAEINIDGLGILLIPWINSSNYDNAKNVIQNCKSKIAMGHLEMNGFQATRGHVMENGMEVNVFDNFTRVYSGHFHTRSNDGKIYYLGNPYEMFWNDVNAPRGFHIFDTETLTHTPIKVIVRQKTNNRNFEKFIDKLYSSGVQDLKIVENFQLQENEEFAISEEENTITILNRYVDESEIDLDKSKIKGILQDIYKLAREVAE